MTSIAGYAIGTDDHWKLSFNEILTCPLLTLGLTATLKNKSMIREIIPSDKSALLQIVQDSGQFDADGLAHVAATLDSHFGNTAERFGLRQMTANLLVPLTATSSQ